MPHDITLPLCCRPQVTYPTLAGFQRRFDERVVQCLQDAGLGKFAENPAGPRAQPGPNPGPTRAQPGPNPGPNPVMRADSRSGVDRPLRPPPARGPSF